MGGARLRAAFYALTLVLVVGAPGTLRAQDAPGPSPVPLPSALAPLASAHHRVSTSDAEAQAKFDQGLTLLDAFYPEEARKRFEAAAERDPHLAMAFWGIAMSYGPNINVDFEVENAPKARTALARAHALKRYANGEERALIAALDKRYAARNKTGVAAAQTSYATAMREVAGANPSDLDVQALYAESLMDLQPWDNWHDDGTPAAHTLEIVRVLEGVLARDPAHLQGLHLYIHVLEASRARTGKAEVAADALAAMHFEPAAEHLAHMPSHIYTNVGRFADSVRVNETAVARWREALAQPHAAGHDGYLDHDLMVLANAAMMAGQHAAARRAALELAGSAHADAWIYVALRFHRWPDILAANVEAKSPAALRFARALAFAAAGDLPKARAERAAFDALHRSDGQARVSRALIAAAIDRAEGEMPEAIEGWERAVALEDALGYGEPPWFFYPVRETLGAGLLEARRFPEARKVFEADLARHPGSGRDYFGLAAACEALGDSACAERARAAYQKAWQTADAPLTLADF